MKKIVNLLTLGLLAMAGAAEAQTHVLSDGVKRMTAGNSTSLRSGSAFFNPSRSLRIKNKINAKKYPR